MRLFFAIPLPDSVRDAVGEAVRPLRRIATGVDWSRRGNLHLTLRFCGDVEPARVEALGDAVAPWVRRLPPPAVRLVGGGAFPDAHRPRFLWIGVESALEPLVGAIEGAVRAFGLGPQERGYVPHLTVGRVRDGRADRVAAALLEVGEVASFMPDRVGLFESHLGPDGPRYELIRTFMS